MRVRQQGVARWQAVPAGMRDLAPPLAERRTALAEGLRGEWFRWGYREVRTPVLEYLETIVRGAGPGVQDQLFKIVDSGGELLALRPEMTVPIARLAATRLLQETAGPLRLAYVAEVFRGQEAGRGRLREFTQAGVELLGVGGLDGDAEVIALAAQMLRRVGVRNTLLHIGHLGFLDDALAALPEDEREAVRVRLYRKEFAGIEDAVARSGLAQLLRVLPELNGRDAIARARGLARSDRSRKALDELETLMARLQEYGQQDVVAVDLSIIRDFSYYTGIVFEAYGAGSGYPLLGGGRYDGLLKRFGADVPATGFAMGLDRVLDALPDDRGAASSMLLVADEERRAAVIHLAVQFRDLGAAVTTWMGGDWAACVRWAERTGMRWVARMDEEGIWMYDVSSGQGRRVSSEGVAAEIAAAEDARVVAWTH